MMHTKENIYASLLFIHSKMFWLYGIFNWIKNWSLNYLIFIPFSIWKKKLHGFRRRKASGKSAKPKKVENQNLSLEEDFKIWLLKKAKYSSVRVVVAKDGPYI